MKQFFLVSILFTIALVFGACNEKPTEIGENLIDDTLVVKTISSENNKLITQSKAYRFEMKSFDVHTVLLGKSDGFISTFLSRFATSMIPDSISNISIDDIIEAKIFLKPAPYLFSTNSTNNLSFEVKECNNLWQKIPNDSIHDNLNYVNYDILFGSGDNPKYIGNTIGSYNGIIEMPDSTEGGMISLDIDKQYVIDKLLQFDEDKNINTNFGIAFTPQTDCNIINQFYIDINADSVVDMSRLQLIYRTKDEENSDRIDTIQIIMIGNGIFTDTPKMPESTIALQDNYDLRTEISLNLDTIPQIAGLIKSELILTLDSNNTILGNQPADSLIRLAIFANSDDIEPLEAYYSVVGIRDSETGKYVFNSVSGPIEYIIRSGGIGSLILYDYQSIKFNKINNKMDRLVFFNEKAENPENRPILRIAYSYLEDKK